MDYVESFLTLKNLITSDPILKYPDFSKDFTLTTDASNYALGAILSQNNHPICFANRTLNEHETRYCTIEKELLAIIWATQYFRSYLYERKFIIRPDHRPLTWLSNLREPNSKLQGWKCKLEEYNFTVEYIKGKDNIVADALSRPEVNLNDVEIDNISVDTQHSADEDNSNFIEISECPLNMFRHQLIVKKGEVSRTVRKVLYRNKVRTTIIVKDFNEINFSNIFKDAPRKGIVAIFIEDINFYVTFQNEYLKWKHVSNGVKFLKCTKILEDVHSNEIEEIVFREHKINNHRGIEEVYKKLKYTSQNWK